MILRLLLIKKILILLNISRCLNNIINQLIVFLIENYSHIKNLMKHLNLLIEYLVVMNTEPIRFLSKHMLHI